MSETLNILHLRASNFIGGPEKQILEHFRRVDRTRYHLVLGCFSESGRECDLLRAGRDSGFDCFDLLSRSSYDPGVLGKLKTCIREKKIHVLCTHGYKPDVVGRIATWTCGIPAVAISRGWTGESPRVRAYEWLDKRFMALTDKIVAVSEGQRKKILEIGIPPEKVKVIYNGIESNIPKRRSRMQLRKELGFPADSTVILSGGRLSPEKNFDLMIEAARQVVSENSNTRFAIFGEGVLRPELERKIREAGLSGKFLLPGFRPDFPQLLSGADIFVLPSFTEGLPNVLLESYARRVPVIATPVGGVPEIVEDGVTGFLVRTDDVRGLADRISLFSKDPDLRRAMGKAGRDFVCRKFNFDLQTLSYQELYEKMAMARFELLGSPLKFMK